FAKSGNLFQSFPKQFYEQVDGELVEGWVGEDGRSYRAWGMFRGKEIRVRGRSESDAINQWRDAANYNANE
ncbi:hypothetical protein, partial [Pseudomonas syringae group genomosp. 3]|uniref:hypothetical protein n=2 Tax=Pseudomonas syringae group genomosp. 3 TaxID=251701 RepID=UPI0006B8CD78